MPERRPAVPGLYSIDDGDSPPLEGRRCLDCGYLFFPPHGFGCEACGALPERVERAALEGAGVLRSLAVVHRHGGGGIEAPFTVGEIALDAGPMVRAVLTGSEALAIGDRVRSVLCAVTAPAGGRGDDRGLWSRTVNAGAGGGAGEEAVEKVELRFEKARR